VQRAGTIRPGTHVPSTAVRRPSDKPTSQPTLDELEEAIEELKVAYERYFNGVDKIPPNKLRDAVDKQVRDMPKYLGMSAVSRFRYGTLKSRFVTYSHYWTRILGQIENGTFKRVVAEQQRRNLMDLRRSAHDEAARAANDQAVADDTLAADERSGASGSAAARIAAARAAAASRVQSLDGGAASDGLDPRKMRELFRRYVEAKKAAGESVEGLNYGAMVKKLSAELPKLQQKHGGAVDFEVQHVEGRVRLRARRADGA
jgi:hypothetical protein